MGDDGTRQDEASPDAAGDPALASDAGGGADAAAAAADPCPQLPIPASCFGREVMYREWGPNAGGDGSYFADQAPTRLGFTRVHGRVWIAKFKTEEDSYRGAISAYGDSVGGLAWISDQPCDPSFALSERHVLWGAKGGGMLSFVVARDDAAASALAAAYPGPQLRGGHCYYAAFENTSYPQGAIDPGFFTTAADPCGNRDNPTCSYLAFDFNHRLHGLDGGTIGGNVLPGFTGSP